MAKFQLYIKRYGSVMIFMEEKGHASALQTFSQWRWGGMVWQYAKIHTLLLLLTPEKDQVRHHCHMQSISGFSPEKDCIGNRPWKMREPSG